MADRRCPLDQLFTAENLEWRDKARDIAERVDITERAVQRIIHDLVEAGFLTIQKEGRRNRYEPNLDAHLRHPLESGATIGQLLRGVKPDFCASDQMPERLRSTG